MSKELEALKRIETMFSFNREYKSNYYKDFSNSEVVFYQDFNLVFKSLKALEIIKEKRIDIESFYTSFIEGDYDYSFYERRYGTYGKYCLTEEEFNLLKEVLEE